ncbi:MAG: phosphatase PAP2 family protein [Spirochaetales bacterium]|nr:phosphatase PAP2 family protein [Spirochaetales bacterium]
MPNNPDYYLLTLQSFRNATGDFLTPIFETISAIAVSPAVIILAAMFYWMLDKKNGLWFFCGYSSIQYLNAVIKLTFCIYRPWIYCSDIAPAGNAMQSAWGYSFPSAHSSAAAAIYGTPMIAMRKTRIWFAVGLGLMILLTMFSRNYLGVHTLQDVVVGGSVSLVLVVVCRMLLAWVEQKPSRDIVILSVMLMLVAMAMIYFIFKPYPMDYVNGELLVDPIKMQDTAFMGLGFLTGFVIGWFIERRWVKFDNSGTIVRKVIFSIIGVAIFAMIYLLMHKIILRPLPVTWRYFIEMTFVMLYIVGLWPIAVKRFVNVKTPEKNSL